MSRQRIGRAMWGLTLALALVSAAPLAEAQQVIKLAVGVPLTGPLAKQGQEVSNAVIDVIVDGLMREHGGRMTEIVRPTSQNHIEAVAHFRPRCQVEAIQTVGHFLPQPSQTLLRRPGP